MCKLNKVLGYILSLALVGLPLNWAPNTGFGGLNQGFGGPNGRGEHNMFSTLFERHGLLQLEIWILSKAILNL